MRLRVLVIVLSFILSVVYIDFLVFSKWIFQFPNELEWDTSHWYNFQENRLRLPPFSKESPGILVSGSSVALYSVFPKFLEKSLNERGRNLSVRFYSHVAMSPADFYFYSDDIIEKNPTLVVYALNPADFQFDPIDSLLEKAEFNEKKWLEFYTERAPVKFFYPREFLKTYYADIPRQTIFNLLTKSILYVNRERSFILDPFFAYYERHLRGGRSYHNYTGIIPEEGIYRKGWTVPEFHIHCEVPPGGGNREELLFIQIPDTGVKIFHEGREIFSSRFTNTGWKKILLPMGKDSQTQRLRIVSDRKVSSKEIDPKSFAREEFYGIRLSQNFCRNEYQTDIAYDRRDALEDINLSNMSLEEYKEDYQRRLLFNADKRYELIRQNHARVVKGKLANKQFTPWVEFIYFKKAIEKLQNSGIRVLIVNAPENPLESNVYSKSLWYSGYLEYMESLKKDKFVYFQEKLLFFDDPRNFIDINHLTFRGAEIMTAEYKKMIEDILDD